MSAHTDKYRETAREVVDRIAKVHVFRGDCEADVAAALANAEREGMKRGLERAAEIVEEHAPGGEHYEDGHDDASMRIAIRAEILSESGEGA